MQRIQELIQMLGDKDVIARERVVKSQRKCKICEGPAKYFHSAKSEIEYNLSMICQKCQDYFY